MLESTTLGREEQQLHEGDLSANTTKSQLTDLQGTLDKKSHDTKFHFKFALKSFSRNLGRTRNNNRQEEKKLQLEMKRLIKSGFGSKNENVRTVATRLVALKREESKWFTRTKKLNEAQESEKEFSAWVSRGCLENDQFEELLLIAEEEEEADRERKEEEELDDMLRQCVDIHAVMMLHEFSGRGDTYSVLGKPTSEGKQEDDEDDELLRRFAALKQA